jgi:hypothetical protein
MLAGCKREVTQEKGEAPPPVASAVAGLCSKGPAKVTDPAAAKLLVNQVGGYCLDPNNEVRTYGKEAKGTIEQVCTELFDGECEVYRSFGLERVVSARYADGEGSPGTVTVNLSRFETPQGALGFFTKRVIGDADPATLNTEKMDAGGLAVLGSGTAYIWRGTYVVELAYANDNEAPDAIRASGRKILPPLGQAIGEQLPGDKQLPRAARLLPEKDRLPHGLFYEPKDILGIDGVGPGAIGFYKDGEKRYRILVLDRANEEAASDVIKTLKRTAGAAESKGNVPTWQVTRRVPDSSSKTEWLFARSGKIVLAIGDEEHALGDQAGKSQLPTADKQTKLIALVQGLTASSTAGGEN